MKELQKASQVTLDCLDFDANIPNQPWEHHMIKSSEDEGFQLTTLAIYDHICWGDVYQLGFLMNKDHDLRFFHLNVARFFSPSNNQFLISARSGILPWWQGVMLAVVLLPLHYQALSCQSFTMNSHGLRFIDSLMAGSQGFQGAGYLEYL